MHFKHIIISVLILGFSACNMAPRLHVPAMHIPKHYKEKNLTWVQAQDKLYQERSGHWWTLFKDSALNDLEANMPLKNKQLKIAFANYQYAKKQASIAKADMYPNLTGVMNTVRVRNADAAATTTRNTKIYDVFLLAGLLNYEVDVWGKIRNAVREGTQLAKASRYDVAALSLGLRAQLASDYFVLRSLDTTAVFLNRYLRSRQQVLYLTELRFKQGLSDERALQKATFDLARAQQLLSENSRQRGIREHAIAVLMGEIPSCFHIKPKPVVFQNVIIRTKLPSTLLQSRPDIVAALHRLEAATANIGVAKAAFFPSINFFATMGSQASAWSDLFTSKSLYWSLGPSAGTTLITLVKPTLVAPIFDGFRLLALYHQAKAKLLENCLYYQQTVITAFQEVEDALLGRSRIHEKLRAQELAVRAVKQELDLARHRLNAGLSTYLDVAPIEQRYLQNQIRLMALKTDEQLETIALIKALGGSGLPKLTRA